MLKKIKTFLYVIALRISVALHNLEQDFKSDFASDIDPSKKRDYKKRNNNPLLRKMEVGDRDERYVKDFYEVLKKGDHFMKHASEERIALAADKNGMTYGKKDRWGRRFEHYGFFDPKHKHYGKTLGEMIEAQTEERKSLDDDYPVIFMINNHKQSDGFAKLNDVESTNDGKIILKNELDRKKLAKFRVSIARETETINKIEQLTDFLHVKKASSEHIILEFFIDKKYKLNNVETESTLFKELINIKQAWFRDEWGKRYGFSISDFRKRIDFNNQYEIIKFNAKEITDASR